MIANLELLINLMEIKSRWDIDESGSHSAGAEALQVNEHKP